MAGYKLRAFVRYTTANKIIPGSLIVRKNKPTSAGNWVEIDYDLCCTSTSTTTLS